MSEVLIAFSLTTIAGLSTGIGGFIAVFSKKTNTNFLSISLGFSAGVMIYVSFMEIIPKAEKALVGELGHKMGNGVTVLSFFLGILIIAIIDKLIPESSNPHEIHPVTDSPAKPPSKSLLRTGLFTALAVTIHNFPEGLATFMAALQSPTIAIPIVVAIAIHNIPEGIAVAAPIYHATGSRKKAFLYALISGLSEPIGALIGWLALMRVMTDTVFGIVFASVAGIMVFISLDELLPTARQYGKHHLSIYGLIAGMAIMAISLLLFI